MIVGPSMVLDWCFGR